MEQVPVEGLARAMLRSCTDKPRQATAAVPPTPTSRWNYMPACEPCNAIHQSVSQLLRFGDAAQQQLPGVSPPGPLTSSLAISGNNKY